MARRTWLHFPPDTVRHQERTSRLVASAVQPRLKTGRVCPMIHKDPEGHRTLNYGKGL
jgi:hypothetical protein